MGKWTDGQMDRWTDEKITDGQMDSQTNKQKDK